MRTSHSVAIRAVPALCMTLTLCAGAASAQQPEFRILDTNRSATMQKELQDVADQGFRLAPFQGGWLLSAIVYKPNEPVEPVDYLLLAAAKTGTMQKEMEDAALKGYRFASIVGVGREVAVVMQRKKGATARTHEQRMIATTKIKTMEKEFTDAMAQGFRIVGQVTFVRSPLMGGDELVLFVERPVQ